MEYAIRALVGISLGFAASFGIRMINNAVNGANAVSTVVLKMRQGIQGLERTKEEKEILWNKTFEIYKNQLIKETEPALLEDALKEADATATCIHFTDFSN